MDIAACFYFFLSWFSEWFQPSYAMEDQILFLHILRQVFRFFSYILRQAYGGKQIHDSLIRLVAAPGVVEMSVVFGF